jgi:hypothetical protein
MQGVAIDRRRIPVIFVFLSGGLFMASNSQLLGQPVFTDATEMAGVSYVQRQPTSPPDCLFGGGFFCEPERFSGGAAAGDYDGDGNIDLYVTRLDAPGILFRNLGNGTFQDVTTAVGLNFNIRGNGCGWADIDNDGDLDLFVTTLADTRFYLFIQGGNGRFTEQGVGRGAALAGEDPHVGFSVAFGDYDLDGWLDIFACEWGTKFLGTATTARLLRNRGSAGAGFFDDATFLSGVELNGVSPIFPEGREPFAFGAAFSDLDRDGWPELVIASDFGTSRLFWNNRDGTFTDGTAAAGVGTDENGMGSAIGDYDGDGRLDWFVTSISDEFKTCETAACRWGHSGNRLYRNNGDRTFSDRTEAAGVREGFWGWGAAFFDYDNDGHLDIVMTNGATYERPDAAQYLSDPMRLWRNRGDRSFEEVSVPSGITDTRPGKGLLVFDYDNDGDLDVFVVNNAASPTLYRNDGGNLLDWLRVKVRGCVSNRDGWGTRVEVRVTAASPPQVREIGTTSHFLGQSEHVAHFGLGSGDDPVAQVRVIWPKTGVHQLFHNVARNSTLLVDECAPAPNRSADWSVYE